MIVVMAGGRSSRMGKEKPILEVGGVPMVLRVYEEVSKVDESIVAVSRHTPKTKELCIKEGIEFIETPGAGYVEDINYLLRELGPFISVSSDLPFIKASDVYEMKKEFDGRVSLTGVLPLSLVPRDLNPVVYRGYAIVGVNAVGIEGEEFFILHNPLLALNVNAPWDLEFANRITKILGSKVLLEGSDLHEGSQGYRG
ncbi:NTP transferase domain-containing protein [Pyrococcus kukulkanii]|uniref:NTP transferase domain-containing protein n=1 Tax=Pyrococcus kukulkanii TaxID=1609559 RepID=UPI00082B6B99|nr:NTP transferase domain-containing protein [Pyrococcus kukulkanii]